MGGIAIENFKNCLLNAKIGLKEEDAKKIVRYNAKDRNGNIDYHDFLKSINSACMEKKDIDNVGKLARNIKVYMRSRNMTAKKLI